jgi:diacylglycerol kinase (ATP)
LINTSKPALSFASKPNGERMKYENLQETTDSKIAVIVNPDSRSGSRGTLLPLLERRFQSRLDRVRQVSGTAEATELARQLVREGVCTIVAAGGDGTVNAVVNGVVGSRCRLGILPAGTANDLATGLNLPTTLEAACTNILQGTERSVDVIRVNHWHFITAGGIGLPVHVIETVDQLRRGPACVRAGARLAGSGLYALCMLYQLIRPAQPVTKLEVHLEDGTIGLSVYALLVANVGTIGRYMRVAPEAGVEDGQLRVVAFSAGSPWSFAAAGLRTLNGSHGRMSSVHMFSGRRLKLTTDRPTRFCADGELRSPSVSYDIEVVPRAIHLIRPQPVDLYSSH